MSWKTSIPVGVGIFLSVVAASVIGAAMLLTDKGEELVHLYGDYKALQRNNNSNTNPQGLGQMELLGKWQGFSLTAVDGATARSVGVNGAERGVVVAGIGPEVAAQAQAGGVGVGDVITGVDNKPVNDLADLYRVSKQVDPTMPVVLEVQRQGQTIALVLPPATQAGMGLGAQQPREMENAWGAGVPAAWAGQNFYCPRDGTVLPRGAVSQPFVCPRCQGPLHLYPPTVR